MTDHSQCGESTWLLKNPWVFNDGKKHPRTFCEVGAFDGVQSSNTLLFENLGWAGILVEPDPVLAARCMEQRSAKVYCCAAGIGGGFQTFYINEADRGLSGFTRPGKPFKVQVQRLSSLIRKAGFLTVDLLSIDTEGTELDVWRSLGSIRPAVVIMEYQTCDQPANDKPIIERMETDGYKEVHRTQYNLIFSRR